MKSLKDTTRYDLLKSQLHINSFRSQNREIENSLQRIFLYVYKNTKVSHVEFINEKILCDYIKFQRAKHFQEVSFNDALKDIKNFIYFLKDIKKLNYIPKIDLSVNNYSFWLNLDSENELLK